MDHIKKHIAKVMQPQKESSISLSNSQIVKSRAGTFLKTTTGTLTQDGVANAIKKLASNFKKLDDSFFSILSERAQENGFDDQMLDEAVNGVIDTFHYNEPKVADIISLNPNVKVLNYHEVVLSNDKMDHKAFDYYRPIKIPGVEKSMYASIHDIEKYNLERVEIKEL